MLSMLPYTIAGVCYLCYLVSLQVHVIYVTLYHCRCMLSMLPGLMAPQMLSTEDTVVSLTSR